MTVTTTIECSCLVTARERIEQEGCPLHGALTKQARLRMLAEHRDPPPPPAVDHLDQPAAAKRMGDVHKLLAATRNDPSRVDERRALLTEQDALIKRLQELKEQAKRENARKNFCGFGSPLHEACIEHLDRATITALERVALEKLAAREQQNAARKAAKKAAQNGNGQQAK